MIRLYPTKIPFFARWLFPKPVYRYATDDKRIYLTFDDGPTPQITPWVLDLLKQEQIKATFFCVGSQITKHPDIFKQIIDAGHQIGNHTFGHKNGWTTSTKNYVESIVKTEKVIESFNVSSKLFRPPYGRLLPAQIKQLDRLNYKIIMWSVLSGDFSAKLDPEQALTYLTKNTSAGDIIVFHDNRKAYKNLKIILPAYIKQLKKQGYSLDML